MFTGLLSAFINNVNTFIYKLVVGIGEPLEGPGILEAIANGCIFINPKIEMKFNNKPTNRTVSIKQCNH